MVELPGDAIEALIDEAQAKFWTRYIGVLGPLRQTVKFVAARVRAEAVPRCERTEDHLRHDDPVTVHCDGIGPQVCDPERYQHLGPWQPVKPWRDVRRCTACGTEIGK